MNWKDGEKYLVSVTNDLFDNFGRVVEVTYHYDSPNCNCFVAEETDNWVEEYYCEDDFILIDDEVNKQVEEWIEANRELFEHSSRKELVKAVMIDVLKMR